MMIQSFIVYFSLAIILFILGQFATKRQVVDDINGRNSPFWVWEIVLALFSFAIISGIRWQVGVDHLTYLENYWNFKNSNYFLFEKEPGFEFITRFFATLDLHYVYYFGFLAFVQIFFIYRAFRRERYLYPFLGALIILGPYYLSWMNGIRQMMVATIFIYSIKFIVKRNILKYLLVILIASSIHQSALLLIIFYFIPQKDFFKKRWVTYLIVLIAISLGNFKFWIESVTKLSNLLQLIGYVDYTEEKLLMLIDSETDKNFGPRSLGILFVNLIIIWFSPQLKKVFDRTNFMIYYNISIAGLIAYNLFLNTPHIFLRPIAYLTIFSLVTTSYLLLYLSRTLTKKNLLLYLIIFITAMSYLPISIIADSNVGELDFTNFKFFWDHDHN